MESRSWRLLFGESEGLTRADDEARGADGGRRVGGEETAADQVVEEHAHRGELLFDGRGLEPAPQILDRRSSSPNAVRRAAG